jgi:PPOX class probable F420-dependent enzyme
MPSPPLPTALSEFLSAPNPAVIATVRPDGSPHTAATWYLWEDGRVLVNMDEGRKRLEYLRRDPQVSLTVLGADAWYRHVTLLGRVWGALPRSRPTRSSRQSTVCPGTTWVTRIRSATAAG